ncbi:alkylated DNA repair protein alkB homolog 8 [Drosophila novamexicana]|uniref:alkylated DNA repair protein alkB homolog 8 n=1 Tax=Drosophila novamexicana TaxID=47314 RepID=UPI0011E5EF70|nr:alkylated DNA repair protein alkB homolog 8 [Drosophila novamexicana]
MHVEQKVNKAKKAEKKQRRCLAIIKADCNVSQSDSPTLYLAILNVGLSNGLTEEALLAAAAATGGQVSQVLMLPSKSYCFLVCTTLEDCQLVYQGMHNRATIGQQGAVAYLSYVLQLPKEIEENGWQKSLPNGLVLLPNFVSGAEEAALLQAVAVVGPGSACTADTTLKHRHVKHFGYEFLYGSNNVDALQPLEQPIPTACDFLWQRLACSEAPALDTPDQLTVNEYEPGQGIPPHVDTHSAFVDPILSLSLQSDVVMDFRRGQELVHVLLPRRSLLVMSGESRYDWTHGIKPKHIDVIPTQAGSLTTQSRTKRTSLTFRRLRRGPCDCQYPTLCDTRQTTAPQAVTDELATHASHLEQQNVHEVYDKIANHFSDTRHTPWPQVAEFLNSFAPQSVLLDVGCGNGKYLGCNPQLLAIGCDRSLGLLGVSNARGRNVFRCDCLQLPVRSGSIDGCISIAVIHHLASGERRLTALRELARVLRPGGRALVYVWAKDQRRNDNKSAYLRQNKAVNKQRTTEQAQRQKLAQQLESMELDQQQLQVPVPLPVHTNRTEFQQQDVYVPWKTKDEQRTTFLRYYHVFEEQELERLVLQVEDVLLRRSYYDQGNHCVIFEKMPQ